MSDETGDSLDAIMESLTPTVRAPERVAAELRANDPAKKLKMYRKKPEAVVSTETAWTEEPSYQRPSRLAAIPMKTHYNLMIVVGVLVLIAFIVFTISLAK